MRTLEDNEIFKWSYPEEWNKLKQEKSNYSKDEWDRICQEKREERYWRIELHGKHGQVYYFNENTLGVYTDTASVKRNLKKLPFTDMQNDCDGDEASFTFPWEDKYLKQVGKILKLKKKTRSISKAVSEARRKRMIELNEARRSSKTLHLIESQSSDRRADKGASDTSNGFQKQVANLTKS
ncbi:MAG: hypothetical protein KDD52_05160 [Bdellovibrionales bacterium]|nr:hypothetical protein [Bdellovibrionales bacterium]